MYEAMLAISDEVGMVGVGIILVAYYFLSVGRWIADSMLFQFLNFAGAWLILFSLYFHWNLSSVVIEVAWIAISMVGMYRILTGAANKKSSSK